jgi:hypothetical protein
MYRVSGLHDKKKNAMGMGTLDTRASSRFLVFYDSNQS